MPGCALCLAGRPAARRSPGQADPRSSAAPKPPAAARAAAPALAAAHPTPRSAAAPHRPKKVPAHPRAESGAPPAPLDKAVTMTLAKATGSATLPAPPAQRLCQSFLTSSRPLADSPSEHALTSATLAVTGRKVRVIRAASSFLARASPLCNPDSPDAPDVAWRARSMRDGAVMTRGYPHRGTGRRAAEGGQGVSVAQAEASVTLGCTGGKVFEGTSFLPFRSVS